MKRLSRSNRSNLNKISASAILLFALSLSLGHLAGAAPQKATTVARVAIHHSRISPPHAGVKLLEDILSRMRNEPQIAMSRNKQTFQYQQNPLAAPSPAQGTTDQLLAIRPPESSLNSKEKSKARADKKTTLAMAEPRASYSRASRESSADDGAADSFAESASASRSVRQRRDANNAPWSTQALGKHSNRSAGMSSPGTSAGAYAPNAYQASNKGIQNFDPSEITNRLSPEARQRLAASSSKLFDVAKKFEEAQQLAQSAGKPQAGAGGGYANAARGSVVADERHAQGGAFRNEQKASKIISTNPLITEYDKGNASQFSSLSDEEVASASDTSRANDRPASIARPMPTPAAPMSAPFGGVTEGNVAVAQKPPAEPSLFKHVREFLSSGKDNGNGILSLSSGRQQAEIAEKSKSIEIALLPPSVVTGIPLVRLGTSESETNRALAGKGQLNKTKINDWSVWSLQKPGNDEVSLQIYSRNGQVEAIRIFDSSLISHDFGVKLGDALGTVKQKFGEPAFILSEPQSRGGQNYVYPISQVSFQLAYTSKTTAPKVVSLLIFNAK